MVEKMQQRASELEVYRRVSKKHQHAIIWLFCSISMAIQATQMQVFQAH